MRTMTATEASRSFASLLDEAERGETIIVTRGGRRVATIGPASSANGGEVIAMLDRLIPDEDFARDIEAAREHVTLDEQPWPGD